MKFGTIQATTITSLPAATTTSIRPRPVRYSASLTRSGDPDSRGRQPNDAGEALIRLRLTRSKNQVYVPINGSRAGASAICGAGVTGCIAVFTTTGDDPGLCNGPGTPAKGKGKKGDPVFLRQVCPNNNGHPSRP